MPWNTHRFNADVDIDHRLDQRSMFGMHTLTTMAACPLFISAAYHHLPCFRMLLNAGANPNYNYNGPVSREALVRGRACCMLDAVLILGCEPVFVSLLLDHGADLYLVPWNDPDTTVRLKVNAEALRIYQEAKSKLYSWCCHVIIGSFLLCSIFFARSANFYTVRSKNMDFFFSLKPGNKLWFFPWLSNYSLISKGLWGLTCTC